MVHSCVAFGCTNRATPTSADNGVHFHRFPNDEVRKDEWTRAIRRENFKPTQNSRICSDHFIIDDYFVKGDGTFCLNKDAIPSVFEAFPKHFQKPKTKRKAPKDRSDIPTKKVKPDSSTATTSQNVDEIGPVTDADEVTVANENGFDPNIHQRLEASKRISLDHDYALPNDIDQVRKKYFAFKDRALQKIEAQKLEIAKLKTTVRTQKQKIENFSDLVLELKREKSIDSKAALELSNVAGKCLVIMNILLSSNIGQLLTTLSTLIWEEFELGI